jgi:hypothetical protein
MAMKNKFLKKKVAQLQVFKHFIGTCPIPPFSKISDIEGCGMRGKVSQENFIICSWPTSFSQNYAF